MDNYKPQSVLPDWILNARANAPKPAARTVAKGSGAAANIATPSTPEFGAEGWHPPMALSEPGAPEAEAGKTAKKAGWQDATRTGLGALAGLFEALGMGEREPNLYNLPGAGGADMPSLSPVDKPFQGRADISPDQRQSLALALLR